jgi:thiamine biosynthesis lipoprotein ApbE
MARQAATTIPASLLCSPGIIAGTILPLSLLGWLAMRMVRIAARPASRKRQATTCTETADARRNRRIERGTAWNRSAVSDSSVLSVHAVVVSVLAPARHRKSKGAMPPTVGSLEGHWEDRMREAIRSMLEQSQVS